MDTRSQNHDHHLTLAAGGCREKVLSADRQVPLDPARLVQERWSDSTDSPLERHQPSPTCAKDLQAKNAHGLPSAEVSCLQFLSTLSNRSVSTHCHCCSSAALARANLVTRRVGCPGSCGCTEHWTGKPTEFGAVLLTSAARTSGLHRGLGRVVGAEFSRPRRRFVATTCATAVAGAATRGCRPPARGCARQAPLGGPGSADARRFRRQVSRPILVTVNAEIEVVATTNDATGAETGLVLEVDSKHDLQPRNFGWTSRRTRQHRVPGHGGSGRGKRLQVCTAPSPVGWSMLCLNSALSAFL